MCSPTTSWRSTPAGIPTCSRSRSASSKGMNFDLDLTGFGRVEIAELFTDSNAAGDGGDPEKAPPGFVIQYNIVFDDEAQRQAWFGFIKGLKTDYPEEETLGARLARFIAEQA